MVEFVRNKKTKGVYWIIEQEVINSTNAQDGQIMVLYSSGDKLFVREKKEFEEKFEYIKHEVAE